MHYYLARDLAKRLEVNLAKWKRWSREFLPPDPLGGLQSGYARQYSLREAFMVALGGLLVGELKFGMPEARLVIADLGPWAKRSGYMRFKGTSNGGGDSTKRCPHDLVFVRPNLSGRGGFLYWVQPMPMSRGSETASSGIGNDMEAREFFSYPGVRVLNMGGFSDDFNSRIYTI